MNINKWHVHVTINLLIYEFPLLSFPNCLLFVCAIRRYCRQQTQWSNTHTCHINKTLFDDSSISRYSKQPRVSLITSRPTSHTNDTTNHQGLQQNKLCRACDPKYSCVCVCLAKGLSFSRTTFLVCYARIAMKAPTKPNQTQAQTDLMLSFFPLTLWFLFLANELQQNKTDIDSPFQLSPFPHFQRLLIHFFLPIEYRSSQLTTDI